MNLALAYLGQSSFETTRTGGLLSLSPNLAREPVAFDAALLKPLRFREAISALHEIVVGDLRFKRRDKSAYLAWKKDRDREDQALYQAEYARAKADVLKARENEAPPDFEAEYNRCRARYWKARRQYSRYLLIHHPSLWRQLMPCDPIVTVAEDALLFEGFSKDESSYGCLTVNREGGFGRSENLQLGTTNVDYSQGLYSHFQRLRSYRETRFRVDPQGFEVATEGRADYREEKIALPPSWLAGFAQVQAAMDLPAKRVRLSREAVYSLLAWLKRHKAKTSPRALRFELLPGKPPKVVLEPWEQEIVSHGTVYHGPPTAPIRVWGRRRLLAFARVLPLADSFEIYLLGTGLPTFWVAKMGEMRLTLGLSGWTANDWTRGSAIDLMLPPAEASPALVERVANYLRGHRKAAFDDIREHVFAAPEQVASALSQLARTGQAIRDLDLGAYRWRQIMPQALGEAELGPEHPELAGAKEIMARLKSRGAKANLQQETLDGGLRRVAGKVDGKAASVVANADGRLQSGECSCDYYRKNSFRNGPCRHALALSWLAARASEEQAGDGAASFLDRFRQRWSGD